jgi:hypothetical protein
MMLPNFLVIGAMRCATGWIRQCLLEHPEIFLARLETHFFDRNFEKGLGWWEDTYFSDYQGERAVGEKTATYFHYPEVPRRIAEKIPKVKLICCLRDPIDRAYSHYVMWAREKPEARTLDFSKVATIESEFVQRSLYFKQLRWFLEEFPPDRILIKIYEDKEEDPVAFIQDIFKYLGVDCAFIPTSLYLQTKPGAMENENRLLFSISRVMLHPRAPLTIKKLYNKIRPKWVGSGVDSDTLMNLAHFFSEDISDLEKFLQRDLGCWKSKQLDDY